MRILCELNHESQEPIPLSTISKNQKISAKYLKQLCQPLEKADFIGSVRGVKGGYFLKKGISDINLLELMRTFEENINLTPCTVEHCPSERAGICKIKRKWIELQELLSDFYQNTSVEDFLGDY